LAKQEMNIKNGYLGVPLRKTGKKVNLFWRPNSYRGCPLPWARRRQGSKNHDKTQ